IRDTLVREIAQTSSQPRVTTPMLIELQFVFLKSRVPYPNSGKVFPPRRDRPLPDARTAASDFPVDNVSTTTFISSRRSSRSSRILVRVRPNARASRSFPSFWLPQLSTRSAHFLPNSERFLCS